MHDYSMKERSALCLRCAAMFPATPGKYVKCPNCGWSISASDYVQLFSLASRAFRYGHAYRNIYERQIKRRREITEMYSLGEPPDWAIFMALAAISGIIGNRADALLAAVLKKLFKRRPKGKQHETLGLATDKGVQKLIAYSRDYIDGMENVDVVVRSAVREEEFTEVLVQERTKATAGVDRNDPVALQKALEKAVRATVRKIKRSDTSRMDRARMQKVLSEVWSELSE
jgi:hypothetical protein